MSAELTLTFTPTRTLTQAWAHQQRGFMSTEYEFSTYGKLGFDPNASKVFTVDLGNVQLTSSSCALGPDS